MNQWVDVTVSAGQGELISHVATNLDGVPIGDDDLSPPESSYQRTWHQVGTGVPGQTNQVVVVARDQKGNETSASKTWQYQGGPVTGP
jgi:hypothetical protein